MTLSGRHLHQGTACRSSGSVPMAVLLSLAAAASRWAGATAITVTTATDEYSSGSSACSLREALHAVSTGTAFAGCIGGDGGDIVYIPAGTYTITRPPVPGHPEQGGAFHIASQGGSALTLVGTSGAAATILDAAALDSVINISPGSASNLVITGLTFRGGSRSPQFEAAGINFDTFSNVSDASLAIYGSWITGNLGIGLFAESGHVTLSRVGVTDNAGTGIWMYRTGTSGFDDVTISRNVGSPVGSAYDGPGGLRVSSTTGALTVNNATIAYNSFSDSNSNDYGAISTGGIGIEGTPVPTVYLGNSIVARNSRGDRSRGSDCHGALTSQGYNLIGDTDGCSIGGTTTGDLLNSDPQLAPLFDYGYGIPTHMLLPGSLAIAAGNPAMPGTGGNACDRYDERGVDRTIYVTHCDIGAYQSRVDFRVNSTDDASDASPGNGACEDIDGACTLRAAIDEANASATFTMIQLPAGRFPITIPPEYFFYDNHSGTFALLGSQAVTIVGAGAGRTTIDAAGLDRDFTIPYRPVPPSVSFHDLTIMGGNSQFGGGGIAMDRGKLLVDRAIVSHNAGPSGGGLLLEAGAHATIDASTITANTADGTVAYGGGIYVAGTTSADITNSTIAGNTALGGAGGICGSAGSTVSLAFDTIAGNLAAAGGGGIGQNGGGTFFVRDSIIADNTDASGQARDCAANLQVADWTILLDPHGCTIGGSEPGLVISQQDPGLSPLVFQGGPTPTMGLSVDSPAHGLLQGEYECVDNEGAAVLTDQHGLPRPTDHYGLPQYGGYCDLGAFQGESDVIFADGFEN
jgi:CSLREA domain-containing protein